MTSSVIGGALDAIALEMGHKLARMSYSSIIRESEDFGCVLCDAESRQLCESEQSTPLQSGPIPGYIRGVNRRFAELGEEWKPGDVVIHNHPYYGASHGPDVAFVVPVFHRGDLVGFSATTAHHLDLGALTPGTCGIVDATDAYAEGLMFNGIKIEEEGRRNEWVWRLLRDNIRAAKLVVGDMEAQIAAARIGAERYLELVERYGIETVEAACADLMDYAERLLRREIEGLPDGTYEAEGRIDGYLDHPDPAYRDQVISVAITIAGSAIHVDLAGTSSQVDLPINMPFEGTTDVAVYLTLRSILLDSAVRDPVPINAGLFRPITISAPEGCLANPVFPAPVIARFGTGNILSGTVMRALAPVCPDRVSAGIGNLKVVSFSGLRDGEHWVHMEICEGSYGGRSGKDGLDAVDTLYANTRNNPIEDIESHYPLRVLRYELREDGGGAGRWRGGIGSVREFMFVEPGGFSVEADGNKWAPPGLFGGDDGAPGEILLDPGTERELALPSKIPYRKAQAGEVLRLVAPSGGGYGDPAERDPEAIRRDVADGLLPEERAREDYPGWT
ncbi:MAG: hydantoinase B/oxoprolinase family protein [Gaiellales bacterium]